MSGKEVIPPFSVEAQSVRIGTYRHYGGGMYQVIALGREESDLSEVVIYQSIAEPEKTWVRPVKDFVSMVEKDGALMPRFLYCGDV